MATTQVLKVTHRVEHGVESTGGQVKGVGDQVKGVASQVKGVDSQVMVVGGQVKGVDDKVKDVDDKVNVVIKGTFNTPSPNVVLTPYTYRRQGNTGSVATDGEKYGRREAFVTL